MNNLCEEVRRQYATAIGQLITKQHLWGRGWIIWEVVTVATHKEGEIVRGRFLESAKLFRDAFNAINPHMLGNCPHLYLETERDGCTVFLRIRS